MKFFLVVAVLSQALSTYAQAQSPVLTAHDHFTAKIKDGVTTLTVKEEGAGDLSAFAKRMAAAGVASVGSSDSNVIISCKQHTTNSQYGSATECKFQYVANVTGPEVLIGTIQQNRIVTATQHVLGLELVGPLSLSLANSYGQQVLIKIGKSQTLISLQYNGGL